MYKFRPKTLFIGQKINYLPTCQSTNDVAADLIASETALDGAVVITGNQTAGRGQRGNQWEAQPNQNLTFSVILQPTFLQASEQFWLNIAISLGISDWLATYVGDRLKIKWPNDLYVLQRKIGGILIENTLYGYTIAWSVVGIGLNINQTRFQTPTATSLSNETPNDLDFVLPELFPSLLESLERRYLALRAGQRDVLKTNYLQRLFRYQEESEFRADGKHFRGIIVGVEETGRLAIQVGDKLRSFAFKEVEFVIDGD
ncbi:biotin--[acetyl-CoA-carboxylase] ligase [Larkinella humicola]|uniref:Biotin--[acetyl-CoA-carboxylase] ligase n=1 Tax=Larkinella humicola TaxID=2607654 RepID=A0A5N1JN71_9BACT|nr:biotin--[acetyl-CoA-carboxylase] ligase [Larkinella humicola]KAA9357601.1 biotin--[acetyl-CoA-carboxylase] ligase [Larkinella humicola]